MTSGKRTERYLAYGFGTMFLCVVLTLAIAIPHPTPFQYTVFRIVLSLAAAGAAAMIPGFLTVEVSKVIRATGAMAVFLVVYFFSPAELVVGELSSSDVSVVDINTTTDQSDNTVNNTAPLDNTVNISTLDPLEDFMFSNLNTDSFFDTVEEEETTTVDAFCYLSINPFLLRIGNLHYSIYCPARVNNPGIISLAELPSPYKPYTFEVNAAFGPADVHFWLLKKKDDVVLSGIDQERDKKIENIIGKVSKMFDAKPFKARFTRNVTAASFVNLSQGDTIFYIASKDVFLSVPCVDFAIYCPGEPDIVRELSFDNIEMTCSKEPVTFFPIHLDTTLYAFVKRSAQQADRGPYEVDLSNFEKRDIGAKYWTPDGKAPLGRLNTIQKVSKQSSPTKNNPKSLTN